MSSPSGSATPVTQPSPADARFGMLVDREAHDDDDRRLERNALGRPWVDARRRPEPFIGMVPAVGMTACSSESKPSGATQ